MCGTNKETLPRCPLCDEEVDADGWHVLAGGARKKGCTPKIKERWR